MTTRTSGLQAEIQQLLDAAVADGREDALQMAAYWNGECIVDAWSAPDAARVDGDSLFPIFSTGKGIAATAVHGLVKRGVLSLDVPICHYWPEFGAEGKDGITLRHVLRHTAGLPMMPEQGDSALAADWEAMCAYLAASRPLHPPGARRHYHAITYGWLVGETVRRAGGRDIVRVVDEDICQPLRITGLFFGVPSSLLPRCVNALKALPMPPDPGAPPPGPPDPVAQRAIPSWVCPLEDWINERVTRQSCLPASTGFANARAVARHYAALVGAGVDGVRLLSDATLDAATAWDERDRATPGNGRWAGGYGLQGPDESPASVIGHGGYGGSIGFADRRLGLSVGFVKSRMGGGLTGQLVETIRQRLRGE